MAPQVVTFGEVMLRLATNRRERFTQAREFEVTYGGGECNVAVSLAHFGIDVPRARVERDELVPFVLSELTRAPELWAQKSHLARAVFANGETDIIPLAEHFLQS
jgi:sugar/nucleoside kinase (ribokinase family)